MSLKLRQSEKGPDANAFRLISRRALAPGPLATLLRQFINQLARGFSHGFTQMEHRLRHLLHQNPHLYRDLWNRTIRSQSGSVKISGRTLDSFCQSVFHAWEFIRIFPFAVSFNSRSKSESSKRSSALFQELPSQD
jgi:hypothetical protein